MGTAPVTPAPVAAPRRGIRRDTGLCRAPALVLAIGVVTVAASTISPILSPIGPAEIVWNATADRCPQTKWVHGIQKPCEEPDSMPIAWHNPLTNLTSLISATSCTYASVGPTLSTLTHHDCKHARYVPVNDSRPWTYANHQWLQSTRVYPNGTGVALIHNEFHGELSGNQSYCTFDRKTAEGQCIFWSTDLGKTVDGGDTWELAHAPLLTLPRPYVKDAGIAGYGELGSILHHAADGYYYAHVSRSYRNNTGGGPPGTVGGGTCVFRTATPADPTSYRGWNGSDWSTTSVDPYTDPAPADDLWRHTCAAVDIGGSRATHLNPKEFAGPLTQIAGWPTHAMVGLPSGKNGSKVSVFLPAAEGAPFTTWVEGQPDLDLDSWMDPCTIGGGQHEWMYPNLIDHASPFGLSDGGDAMHRSDGLSYTLVGNSSLYLYAVLSRAFIIRIPVAWFQPGQPLPTAPFPPAPPPALNPAGCTQFRVSDASIAAVNGIYNRSGQMVADGTYRYKLDDAHELYHFQATWRLGQPSVAVYYVAHRDIAARGDAVPIKWGNCGGPVVHCIA
eukprot:m.15439 g.15439  ORF g.15439 m.15439 type:complete len:559 (+) comp8660_c0_seq1:210-1886(+)